MVAGACFLPGRTKDLPATWYYALHNRISPRIKNHDDQQTTILDPANRVNRQTKTTQE